jgi:iron complex transport system substrate-binding protein
MIAQLGGLIGVEQKAQRLIAELHQNVENVLVKAAQLRRRPRVFFEEWYDPLISGIGWVSELIGIAGGDDVFPELAREPGAKQRIIAEPLHVVERMPDIVIGSWCGRKFKPEHVLAREGWDITPAVQNQQVFEIKSPLILQPGPAALSDGLAELQKIIVRWAEMQ